MTMHKRKIAYILTPITFGGAEKVSLNFLRNVDRNKFLVRPILLVRPWEPELYFANELEKCGYGFDTVPVAIGRRLDPMRVPRVVRSIYRLLKGSAFDLVHTHGYFADICGLPVAGLLGIPGISTCHGFINFDLKLRIYNFLDKVVLRSCRLVLCVSGGIRGELVSAGLREDRVRVLRNAVDLPAGEEEIRARRIGKRSELSIGENEFLIGYVGRLSEEKGLVHLIEAAVCLQATALPYKVVLIGDGPAREGLEALVRRKGLGGKFIFAGFRPNVDRWLPALDILALPSLTEGTPMALLEAMSMGVPVVATAVGGVPDVISDGKDGFLVGPGDPAALSDRIRTLLTSPCLHEEIRTAARKTIQENYETSRWARQIEQEYESCIQGQSSLFASGAG